MITVLFIKLNQYGREWFLVTVTLEDNKIVDLESESSFPLDASTVRKRKTADIVNKEVMEGNIT